MLSIMELIVSIETELSSIPAPSVEEMRIHSLVLSWIEEWHCSSPSEDEVLKVLSKYL